VSAGKQLELLENIDAAKPVVIAGATASGKSALALDIARRQGGVIVNADALQVWACWRVLSARPMPGDEAEAPHLLYGHQPRDADYSVGHWLREVGQILQGPERPIIVGGTGLYLSALTEGLADIPPVPPEIRAEADQLLARAGHEAMLAELDPATAARIDRKNPARIQRAWEVLRATGRGLVEWQAETGAPLLPLGACTALVLDADRDWLAERIDRRFGMMVETGALDEVRAILPHWSPSALWAKAIGAPELVRHLRDEITLPEAITAAQASSRQYAKRQRSWFRGRMRDWRWIARP
jgi:tRNA dimethylallyltransferase